MLGRIVTLFSIISLVCGEISNIGDSPEKARMIGVDTIHDVKIDKDTVLTRNLAAQRKNRDKNVPVGVKRKSVKKDEHLVLDYDVSIDHLHTEL